MKKLMFVGLVRQVSIRNGSFDWNTGLYGRVRLRNESARKVTSANKTGFGESWLALGLAVPPMAGMAARFGDCEDRYGHGLAAEGISFVSGHGRVAMVNVEDQPWRRTYASLFGG